VNVEQLREALAEWPDYYTVGVEVIVGGDLGTQDVDVELIRAGQGVGEVVLVAAPDEFRTRELIDLGLAVRQAVEESGLL
jgi:hypothetical protein